VWRILETAGIPHGVARSSIGLPHSAIALGAARRGRVEALAISGWIVAVDPGKGGPATPGLGRRGDARAGNDGHHSRG